MFKMMAMQEMFKGGSGGLGEGEGKKLLLMPIAQKFTAQLTSRIAKMDNYKRARLLAALVQMGLAQKVEGEYSDILDYGGYQGLLSIVNAPTVDLSQSDYNVKPDEQKQLGGEVGGSSKPLESPANEAKNMNVEGKTSPQTKHPGIKLL